RCRRQGPIREKPVRDGIRRGWLPAGGRRTRLQGRRVGRALEEELERPGGAGRRVRERGYRRVEDEIERVGDYLIAESRLPQHGFGRLGNGAVRVAAERREEVRESVRRQVSGEVHRIGWVENGLRDDQELQVRGIR